jgi:hydrogenase nickel incorporation protein HypA/HybF
LRGQVNILHELGVVIEVINTVESFAKNNGLEKIDTLVLQIGELSSMIPRYIEACYPIAVEGTLLQDSKLKIEVLPGNALCRKCGKVFNIIENHSKCPSCGDMRWELLSGREFMIKEIVAC